MVFAGSVDNCSTYLSSTASAFWQPLKTLQNQFLVITVSFSEDIEQKINFTPFFWFLRAWETILMLFRWFLAALYLKQHRTTETSRVAILPFVFCCIHFHFQFLFPFCCNYEKLSQNNTDQRRKCFCWKKKLSKTINEMSWKKNFFLKVLLDHEADLLKSQHTAPSVQKKNKKNPQK